VRRASLTVLLWALFLAVLTGVGWAIFDFSDPETVALLGGAAVLVALFGAYLLVRRRAEPGAGDRSLRVVPDSSLPTAWVAISIAILMLGAELGMWLVLIGGGMLLAGVAGLVREWRAGRATLEAARAAARASAPRGEGGAREPAGGGRSEPRIGAAGEG
jgi:hypothetical protein